MSLFDTHLARLERVLPHLTPKQLHSLMQGDSPPLLLDVREPAEVESGAIPGSVNLPRTRLESQIEALLATPRQPIVVYCGSRGRSQLVCHALREMGLDASYLAGGLKAWREFEPAV